MFTVFVIILLIQRYNYKTLIMFDKILNLIRCEKKTKICLGYFVKISILIKYFIYIKIFKK